MASVKVSYDSRRFRVKLSPSGVLSDVVSQSLKHFGLIREGVSGKWGLFHNGKEVEPDVPWRLLNLPGDVELELKPSSGYGDDEKIIKVRMQVPGHDPKLKSVRVNSNVQKFINDLWPILDSGAKLQFLSTEIPLTDLNDHTWKSLGITESISVRIISPVQANEVEVKSPNANGSETSQVQQEDRQRENPRLHQVFAYVPSDKSLASKWNAEQEREGDTGEYELTLDHAKTYRRIVQRQAGGLGGPMVPRKVKEQEEALNAASRRRIIQECIVRVRFPDRTHIEIAFKGDDIISTVYRVVLDSLRDNQSKFTLYHSRPHVALPLNDQELVRDLHFGSRTLLLFESNGKGPFLKDGVLNRARSLSEADDVQLDGSEVLESNVDSKKQDGQPKKTNTPGKYPKWLKLSKK